MTLAGTSWRREWIGRPREIALQCLDVTGPPIGACKRGCSIGVSVKLSVYQVRSPGAMKGLAKSDRPHPILKGRHERRACADRAGRLPPFTSKRQSLNVGAPCNLNPRLHCGKARSLGTEAGFHREVSSVDNGRDPLSTVCKLTLRTRPQRSLSLVVWSTSVAQVFLILSSSVGGRRSFFCRPPEPRIFSG